jgi:hypothetical protein
MINRHSAIPIPKEIIQTFLDEVGDVKSPETNSVSKIWNKVFDKYDKTTLRDTRGKDPKEICELFEEYFINGLSDGACAGQAMGEFSSRYKYSKREKTRLRALYLHMNPGVERSYSHFGSTYKISKEQLNNIVTEISEIPLSNLLFSGMPWLNSLYGKNYLLEISDHYYFYDVIKRYMRGKILRPVFIGDGSGILSNMLLSLDCQVENSIFIDLQHFLIRQYIVNFDHRSEISRFIYAQDFNQNIITDDNLTIINQDSFPEIPSTCLKEYFSLIQYNKVNRVISYNHLDLRGHVNYRGMLLKYFGEPLVRFESPIRKGYFIEIFER